MFLTLPYSASFVAGLFLCAGSQSVAFCFFAKVVKSQNLQFYYVFLTICEMSSFVVGLFLCAGSQSVAFRFLAKVLKSWNMQFSYECCAFLHTVAMALNAAMASNGTRSR